MNLTKMVIINSTVTGFSHTEDSKECQDYSMSWRDDASNLSIIVVSDGHGGKGYENSAIGSKTACTVAIESIRSLNEILPSNQPPTEEDIRTLCRCITSRWISQIETMAENTTDSIKSYGCTLIAYAQTPNYWFALQIGDGRCAILNESWKQPIEWDDNCFLNFTTSLCDEDAYLEFRSVVGDSTQLPDAIFLCSDGVDGTFGNGEHLYHFFNHIIESIESDGETKVYEQLPEVLSHYSAVGSKDDMSIAFILNHHKDRCFTAL